ncbi:MAG: hypothetical protein PHW87_05940 [Methanothrix sp.]|nr:hypothetical protein [Methanothrix sp.]
MCMSKTNVFGKFDGCETESFSSKTSRGRRLLALRQKIIAAGILQSPEEIDEESRSKKYAYKN